MDNTRKEDILDAIKAIIKIIDEYAKSNEYGGDQARIIKLLKAYYNL